MNALLSGGEVRLALRLIVKQPILSGTIILALATGICLATMGFTFRDELVNSSLPYQRQRILSRGAYNAPHAHLPHRRRRVCVAAYRRRGSAQCSGGHQD